jgi:acetolactate synthase-1/2/3 large subunit
MGSGLGSSVGLAAGWRDRPVATITGDGCFAMQLGAIAVAAREKLPIVFCVLDDQRLGMCEIGHEFIYEQKPDYDNSSIDIVRTAEGLGARAVRISSPDQLAALDLVGMLKSGPIVLDVMIDKGVRMPRNARNDVLQTKGPQKVFN